MYRRKLHTNTDFTKNFPTEISENILCRLPIDAGLQAKRVCKTWRNLLRKKTDKVGFLFAESYSDENQNKLYYGDEYDPLTGKMKNNYSYDNILDQIHNGIRSVRYGYGNMLGSCNGLVCFQNRRSEFEKPFLICNPLTREVVYVPKPNKSIEQYCSPTDISGFGYRRSKNEYKIVRMYYLGQSKYHVLVYTIGGGGGGWRSLGSIHIGSLNISSSSYGTYANESLYWLYYNYINIQRKQLHYTIMAFDMEVEKFEFIHLSHFEDLRHDHRPKLLGGRNLCLVYTTFNNQPSCTHIWAYKKENTNTTT